MIYSLHHIATDRADELAKAKIVINAEQGTIAYRDTVIKLSQRTPSMIVKREVNALLKRSKTDRQNYLQSKQGRLL